MNIQPACGTETGLPVANLKEELRDIQHDAVNLHALTQGAWELFDGVQVVAPSPTSNALCALLGVIIEKAERLQRDLDELEMRMRR